MPGYQYIKIDFSPCLKAIAPCLQDALESVARTRAVYLGSWQMSNSLMEWRSAGRRWKTGSVLL